MVDVPDVIAANRPEVASIVPTALAALAHVPPEGVLLNVRVSPTQTAAVPLIVAGNGLTVNVAEREQPVDSVYETVVVPAEIAETTPAVDIVATPVVLLVQIPPDVVFVSVSEAPAHANRDPPIAAGLGCTVSIAVR